MGTRFSARGIIASTGYASGPLFLLESDSRAYSGSGDAAVEAGRLTLAIARARDAVAALMEMAEGDAADILEFQVAMLEDEGLSAPSLDTILAGADAASAWAVALDAEIAGYEAAEDSYFRARSADLRDIRDRVLRALSGSAELTVPAGALLFGRDLTPTGFLAIDWAAGGGIVLSHGSSTSHVAMLARARGVPMLVGVGSVDAANDDFALLDAERGRLIVLPDTEERHEFLKASVAYGHLVNAARSQMHREAMTTDGVAVAVSVNVAQPADVEHIDIATCDGVGLMRTEFLFDRGLPDEETQLAAYRKVLEWAGDKPVVIRTVDAGGDKPVPGLTIEESNPFLGTRGIRLALARPEVFRVQIRALLRAAPHGNLKVMLPMVSIAAEYDAAQALFAEEAAALAAAGIPHAVPPLGIMVEVPAAALAPEQFAHAAFFSIGSNDLTQYVMAAARDNGAVAALGDVRHPAVLKLIRMVADFGRERGIPVSLCGDAGSSPEAIPALLGAGLRSLSVAPAQLALAKAAVARASSHG